MWCDSSIRAAQGRPTRAFVILPDRRWHLAVSLKYPLCQPGETSPPPFNLTLPLKNNELYSVPNVDLDELSHRLNPNSLDPSYSSARETFCWCCSVLSKYGLSHKHIVKQPQTLRAKISSTFCLTLVLSVAIWSTTTAPTMACQGSTLPGQEGAPHPRERDPALGRGKLRMGTCGWSDPGIVKCGR